MTKLSNLLWFITILTTMSILYSGKAAAYEFSGLLQSYFINTSASLAGQKSEEYQLYTLNGRIDLFREINQNWQLQVADDVSIVQQPKALVTQGAYQPIRTYRSFTQENLFASDDGTLVVTHNLDRFQLTYDSQSWRTVIGRQAIWFGVGQIANPTDVFLPLAYGQINPEYRIGIDGVRITKSVSDLTEFEVGQVFGEDFAPEKDAQFLRAKSVVKSVDIESLLIHFLDANLVGFNLQTSLAGLGVFSEASWVHPDNEDPYLRYNIGATYMFESEWVINGEFHYNGIGEKEVAAYSNNLSKFAYTSGGVSYMAQRYLALGGSKAITPLIMVKSNIIANLDDQSAMNIGELSYSFTDATYANLSWIQTVNNQESGEFYSYPRQLYLMMKYYF